MVTTTKKTVKSGGYASCADHAAPVRNDQAGGRKSASKRGGKTTTKGGNLAKDVSNLLVPFGLILAKESLEQFLKKEKSSARKPSSRSRRVSLQKKK
jgi:hypothetical protein